MQWEILSSAEALAKVAPEWEALQGRAGRFIFTGHAWVEGWWRFIGTPSGASLLVVTGRKDGKLVAVAPLAIRRRGGVRLLEWAAGPVSDYSDFLLEKPEDAQALWTFARENAPYDLAHIKEVHPESVCLPPLVALTKPVKESEARTLRLEWPSFDAWMATLPYAVRKHYRARVKQAESIGPLKYEVLRDDVPEEAIARLVAQKAALLAAQGRHGVFDAAGAKDFFYSISTAEGKNGALHFSTLRCGEHVIATHLGFVHGGAFLSYMPSYDEGYSQLSPGRLMMLRCIGWAMENGLKEFDFMRGEDTYKGRFSNDARMLKDFMFARTLKGRAAMWLYLRRKSKTGEA